MSTDEYLKIEQPLQLHDATLVMAFSGWMDGGDASTGTVRRLVDLLDARHVARIDPDPFYILNFPGPMELAAMFRPEISIQDGIVESVELPESSFFAHEAGNLALFIGREPNLHWGGYRDCIFRFANEFGVKRLLFVGSFGGSVPHTREPRMYVACSDPDMLPEMEKYGVGRTAYQGPGSFTSYLLTEAPAAGVKMTSIVAEIPGYLQGTNPACILAITRRLSTILGLSLDLDELRQAATDWEHSVSSAVEDKDDLAETVRKLEEDYDNELLAREEGRG